MEQIVDFIERLTTLPLGVRVFFGCISFGYVLKVMCWFPNSSIPAAVMAFGVFAFMLVSPTREPDSQLRIWIGSNVLSGMIISNFAWLAHRFVLKWVEKRFSLFDQPDPPKEL